MKTIKFLSKTDNFNGVTHTGNAEGRPFNLHHHNDGTFTIKIVDSIGKVQTDQKPFKQLIDRIKDEFINMD